MKTYIKRGGAGLLQYNAIHSAQSTTKQTEHFLFAVVVLPSLFWSMIHTWQINDNELNFFTNMMIHTYSSYRNQKHIKHFIIKQKLIGSYYFCTFWLPLSMSFTVHTSFFMKPIFQHKSTAPSLFSLFTHMNI